MQHTPTRSFSTSNDTSPVKKGYEAAPDYEPEKEAIEEEKEDKEGDSVVSDEEFPPAKRAKKVSLLLHLWISLLRATTLQTRRRVF